MKDIKRLIEELKLLEDDIAEINLQDEIEPEEPAQVIDEPNEEKPHEEKPVFGDNMSLADQFDAKARIARALEALKAAVDEFKDATAEKLDLLQDQDLTTGIEKLDSIVVEIEAALAGGSQILGNSELNDPFKPELPEAPEEAPEAEEKEDDEAEDEEEEEEYDFDAEAGLDLLGDSES